MSTWNQAETDVYKLPCFKSKKMESFFVARRSSVMIDYHPYFVNYGYNKMEILSRMRFEGFEFYVLMNDFGVDLPHEK